MSEHDYNPNSTDAKLSSIEGKLDQIMEMRKNHEERIVALEKWRYYVAGACMVGAMGGKVLWDVLKMGGH